MQIVHTIAALRLALAARQRPVLIPTMGNLHGGHAQLVQRARALCAAVGGAAPAGDAVVVSIFVNRLQFLPHEDFESYPRTLAADCERLQALGCDLVFAPSEHDLYPQAQTVKVVPDARLADILEGQFRPGFFTGVATVVMKLLQCVFAGKAAGLVVFGQKDYQQCMIVRQMLQQFAWPIDLIVVPTERADDGLALSSRNSYLDCAQRAQAPQLQRALQGLIAAVQDMYARGGHWVSALPLLERQALHTLAQQGWQPDYLTLRRRSDLQAPAAHDAAGSWVALAAARLGGVRLIDNVEC